MRQVEVAARALERCLNVYRSIDYATALRVRVKNIFHRLFLVGVLLKV
jgi:hypothetical protein